MAAGDVEEALRLGDEGGGEREDDGGAAGRKAWLL